MKRNVKYSGKWTILSVLMLSTLLLVWGCGGNGDVKEPEGEVPSQGEETPGSPEVQEPEEPEEPEESEEMEGLTDEDLAKLFTSGKVMDELFYVMKSSNMGEEESIISMYIKGDLMRMESENMGESFIAINAEDGFYTLEPQTKTAMKIPKGMEDEDEETPTLDDFTDDVDEDSMIYLGKESILGVSCHVVESRDLESNYQIKMWLHEEYGFPMRVETIMDNDEMYVSEVIEFKVGNVSDDMFKIPDDYQILDLGNLIPPTP